MNKNLDLAKSFYEKTQKEIEIINEQSNEQIINGLKKREQTISVELQQSEQRITADIHDQQKRMSRLISKLYLWNLSALFTTLALVLLGVNAYIASLASNKWADYQAAKQRVEKIAEASNRMQITTCKHDGKDYECVAVYPNSPQWGKNGEFRVIMPRQTTK